MSPRRLDLTSISPRHRACNSATLQPRGASPKPGYYLHVGLHWAQAGQEQHCAGADFSPHRPRPLPFPLQPPLATELSCVCLLLCRPRFPAATSLRLSLPPDPLLLAWAALLCGRAKSPTPFLCGITMAAGVSPAAPASPVAPSDAILPPERGQPVPEAFWGRVGTPYGGLEASLLGKQLPGPPRGELRLGLSEAKEVEGGTWGEARGKERSGAWDKRFRLWVTPRGGIWAG